MISTIVAFIAAWFSPSLTLGTKIIDWLDRADFISTKFIDLLRWLFSPSGAHALAGLFIVAFFIAVYRTVFSNGQPRQALKQDESSTALIEGEVAKVKEALNAQHQSEIETLNAQTKALERTHEEGVRGYERRYDELKKDHDKLLQQNKGLHAELAKQSWMYNIAGKQAEQINRYVILDRIERGDARLHDLDGWPFIRFHFYILNKSVYDLAVELDNGARDSYIVFKDEGLRSERFLGIPSNELYIPHYTEGCLTIEQRLSPTEAHIIARGEGQDDAVFHFDRLVITIKGRINVEPQVEEKRLVIDKAITLNNALLPRP